MVGAALVGFGIPIKEFGIGNTLIMSGSVVFSAGLVLFGLAAAVARLTRLTDLMAARGPVRDARGADAFERPASAALAGGEGRIPFPSRPKANVPPVAEVRAPVAPPPLPTMPAAIPADEHASDTSLSPSLAPSLRNPDLGLDGRDEPPARKPAVKPASERAEPAPEMNLPPPPPLPSTFAKPAAPQMPPPPPPPPRPAPAMRPPQPNYFDTVWGGDAKPGVAPEGDDDAAEFRPVPRFEAPADVPPPPPMASPKSEAPKFEPPKLEPPKFEPPKFEPPKFEPPKAAPPPLPEPAKPAGEEMHAAAVLKSGVVDGMAYTLYVDGSIEAELPDGTLRFASINALREHLEKSGG
jgi:hypothetical protein